MIAELARLPRSLQPFVRAYADPDDLYSLSQYAGWKTGQRKS